MTHGRHIKIVGFGDAERLGSLANVHAFLVDVVHRLGMRPLAPPTMFDVALSIDKMGSEPFEDEGGITGVCVLSTSHCSIHTWPLRATYVLDVYSCRDFNPMKIVEAVESYYGKGDKRLSDLSDSLQPP